MYLQDYYLPQMGSSNVCKYATALSLAYTNVSNEKMNGISMLEERRFVDGLLVVLYTIVFLYVECVLVLPLLFVISEIRY